MKLRPYLSFDLETTGLDVEKSQILQIGWVIDDGISALSDLKRGSVFIVNDQITYGENYALGMNAWIFQELMKPQAERKYPSETLENGLDNLLDAIDETSELAFAFDNKEGKKFSKKIQLAGKNVGNFDWPITINNAKRVNGYPNNHWMIEKIDHRFIECGALYFSDFGKNPSLNEINKMIGWKQVTHDAVDDALNVVAAIRYKMGMSIT